MKILAIDLGLKHTGLATFDNISGISPLATINHRDLYELGSKLRRFIEDYNFDKIIVGDMGGGENEFYVSEFVNFLEKTFDIEYEIVGERYSSRQANQEMQNVGSISIREDHAASALQILRDYLTKKL